MALRPESVLVRAPGLVVRVVGEDAVIISGGPVADVEAPSHALTILDEFKRPAKVEAVLSRIEARGVHGFIEASSLVMHLAGKGVLVGAETPRRSGPERGFAASWIHSRMLDDEARTVGFCNALRRIVTPGDVVVDIGAGTGVLTACAARAGARHVYGIEATAIADTAERLIAQNGVADRATIVRGRSSDVDLPERASVLVTEVFGNDPLDERILDIISDARARLLERDARIVPSGVEIHAFVIDIPDDVFAHQVFTRERITSWTARYGVDFTSIDVDSLHASMFTKDTQTAGTWPLVSNIVPLVTVDFERPFETILRGSASLELTRDASCPGIAIGFRSRLADGIVLSTLPGEVTSTNHWRWPIWVAPGLRHVRAGERLTVDYDSAGGSRVVMRR